MSWTIVLSLLLLFLRPASSNSTLTRSNFEMTASCSDDYLVEGKDFLTFEFEANVNDSSYFSNVLLNGPKFYSTWTRNSYSVSPCTGFDYGDCKDRRGEPNACSCLEDETLDIYRFTYNMTADRKFSNQRVWMVWPGSPNLVSESYQIPEIRAACAKMKFIKFYSFFYHIGRFLVAGKGTTFIQFEVSGNNSVHSFDGENGPKFYYTTTDGVSHEGCSGFDPATGSCTKRPGVRDACSCEMKTSTKYWLSYSKTATVDTSKATVYLLWPGKPDLRSDSYTFPEIRAKAKASRNADGTEHISKAFILAGLGALLAIAAGVALICYYEHGSRQTADRITFIVQSQAPAEGRGEKETETMAKRVEDGNATSSFGSVI